MVQSVSSGVPSSMSFHVPSSAAPTGAGADILTQAADHLERGRDQVADLASHLSRLRQVLVRLSKSSTVTLGKPSPVPAGAYSSSALGLDYGAGDDTAPLASVAALSGVQAGSFQVNGVDIAVDPSTDSLADVVARINASGAGVKATLSKTADVVSIAADSPGDALTLTDATSGFFTGVNVGTGTHDAARTVTRTFRSPATVARQLKEAGEELNAIFGGQWGELDDTVMDTHLGELADALRDAFALGVPSTTGDLLRSDYGITLDLRDLHGDVFTFGRRTFEQAVAGSFDALAHFLTHEEKGSGQQGFAHGLIEALDDSTAGWLEDLTASLTGTGGSDTTPSTVDVTV